MDYFWKKKSLDAPGNDIRARLQEIRLEAARGDASGDVERGILAPVSGPSEQQAANEGEWRDVTDFSEEPDERNSYFYMRYLTPAQRACRCLQKIKNKRDEARAAFSRAGKLDGSQSAYALALKFAQLHIDALTTRLEGAGQYFGAEQATAFMAALEDAENKESRLSEQFNQMIEDAYETNQIGQRTMYDRLTARGRFESWPK